MIEILSTCRLLPNANGHVPQENAKLANAAPAGLARSMNRTGLLLAECVLGLDPARLKLIRENAARAAIYCAAEPSTLAHPEILKYLEHPEPAAYARLIPPKWGLQCSIGLAASAAAILLDIEGGVHTFNHPYLSNEQALQQAALDLQDGVVDYALVCAVSSLEDPLMIARWKFDHPQIQFCEGAGALLIKKGNSTLPDLKRRVPTGPYFGCADPLIQFVRGTNLV